MKEIDHTVLWKLIQNKRQEITTAGSYKPDDIIFIALSLNHLSEWIMNDPNLSRPARRKLIAAHWKLYKDPTFTPIRSFSNFTKHRAPNSSSMKISESMSDWSILDKVSTLEFGELDFSVGGKELLDVVDDVIKLYQKHFHL